MNCDPLSETICSGRPYAANSCLSLAIGLVVEVADILKNIGHLECASTISRNCVPKNCPAKSMCIHSQGFVGHVQGGSGGLVL